MQGWLLRNSVGRKASSWRNLLLMASFSSVKLGAVSPPGYKGSKDMKGDLRRVMKFQNTRERRRS